MDRSRRVSNYFKDKEEELSFFRDLQKRDKDRARSLLQPVSEEFEANGNYALCGAESGGRKGTGLELLGGSGKNDYNWLKTPPATPLFPSLEMEANGQELVVQKEITIIQPLSRFSGKVEGSKNGSNPSAHPKPKLPQRYKTTPTTSDKRNMKTPPVLTNQTAPNKAKPFRPAAAKPTITIPPPSKSTAMEPKPKTRGLSPCTKPAIPSDVGFSDDTPPNLKTTTYIRPASVTRGRATNPNPSTLQPKDKDSKIRRQSCSPSVTRGRKVDTGGYGGRQQCGNGGQVLGSRMVERFMNARVSGSGEDLKQSRIKLNGSLNSEGSGLIGRLISKNSLDMALKHMEIQRDPSTGRKHRVGPAVKS